MSSISSKIDPEIINIKLKSKPLTDLEKWKTHLDEMGIKYEIDNNAKLKGKPAVVLCITNGLYFIEQFRSAIYIIFDIEGKFKCFETNE